MRDKIPYSCLYRLPDGEDLVVRNMSKKKLIKSLMRKVYILLVLLTRAYHDARFRKGRCPAIHSFIHFIFKDKY